jgi:hypothetical protein
MDSVIYRDEPDAEELRLLRALVIEGVAASARSPWAGQFHGWCIRVWRSGQAGGSVVRAEIRCREAGLREHACFWGCSAYRDGCRTTLPDADGEPRTRAAAGSGDGSGWPPG